MDWFLVASRVIVKLRTAQCPISHRFQDDGRKRGRIHFFSRIYEIFWIKRRPEFLSHLGKGIVFEASPIQKPASQKESEHKKPSESSDMELKIDNSAYKERSKAFLESLKKWIEASFEGAGPIDPETKGELTEMLVWNMACLLDGTGNLMCGEKVMVPHLAFSLDDEEHMVLDDGAVVLHEMIDDDLDE